MGAAAGASPNALDHDPRYPDDSVRVFRYRVEKEGRHLSYTDLSSPPLDPDPSPRLLPAQDYVA